MHMEHMEHMDPPFTRERDGPMKNAGGRIHVQHLSQVQGPEVKPT
jgi:hypothetical protein